VLHGLHGISNELVMLPSLQSNYLLTGSKSKPTDFGGLFTATTA